MQHLQENVSATHAQQGDWAAWIALYGFLERKHGIYDELIGALRDQGYKEVADQIENEG